MSPERVLKTGEVSLNAVRYPIKGRVQSGLASIYPPKIVIGDTVRDSNPRTSIVAWNSLHRGLGLERFDGQRPEDLERTWLSEALTLFRGHVTYPFEQLTTSTAAGSGDISTLGERGALVYATRGTAVSTWNGSSWSSSAHTLNAAAVDVEHFFLGGTEYIAWATTGDYDYYGGSSYATSAKDAVYLAYWDDRLWGIDNAGQLWYSSVLGTEVDDAQLQLPAGYVTALFVGPDATGNDIIYAATQVGLYAHDAANARFVRTHVSWPKNSNAGLGATTWRRRIYVSTGGMGIFEYDPQNGFVRAMGLDQDNGLPSTKRDGHINHLAGSHLWLLVTVASATSRGLYGWNTVGWSNISRGFGVDMGPMLISDAVSSYRLYYQTSGTMWRMELPDSNVSPDENSALRFDSTMSNVDVLFPWFDAGQADVDKLALRLRVEVTGTSDTETVTAGYATNYGASFTDFTAITADGVTTLNFQTASVNSGTAFRALRIRIRLNSSTNTDTPDVRSVTLEWRKKIPALYSFQFDVDLSEAYSDRSPREMRAALVAAIESNVLVEFTYRNDTGDTRNYYVDIATATNLEETGDVESGESRVTVVEV